MAPTPGEGSLKNEKQPPADAPISDESIVITGMSALMPGCQGLDEFTKKLYNMDNLANCEEPRWNLYHPEVTPYHGFIPDIHRFDAQFFMVHYRLAQSTDAMSRKLLEQAYQAIIDAGVCPTELSGKRVGVFIATGFSEMHRMYSFSARGSGLLGYGKTMMANRISYWLNAKGPSYSLDASCCGSLVALERACDAMTHGLCDAAIVGGARLTLNPHTSINYRRLIPLNPDGKTKCYDVNADGQTMAEAITTVFLQKYKDARRVYAEIYHIKANYADGLGDEYKDKFGPQRDPAKVASFLRRFYEEAGVSPSSVEYVEGCGAALPDADKAELQAIEQVFCKDRSKPLLVGSVTSNMGFSDASSGLCGVVKLLLAYQRGELAANLHCENPRQDIPALQDGRMRIVTEHERFDRTFTALNNFSVTGMNVHVLLKGYYKNKDISRYHCEIPYMVTVSGRQETAVQKILDNIKSNELDPEEIVLYHEIYKKRIMKHMSRGFGIYATQDQTTVCLCEKAEYFDDARRPLWFVYSGMGSQWAGMGAQLMRIPIFAAAMERCDKVLKPKGVDIVNIITSPDETVFDNILNSFVGIAAIQIGLTDILHAVGLVPDNIIGHSVGELGCAYADGSCTAEEMIMLSYSRGLISTQTPFIRGSMAAVGIGYKQIVKMCPPGIDVACHNGPDSSTISGPAEAMRKFVGQLTSQGVFAKEVKCSNIAYHSRYVAEAGPELLSYSKELVKKPKLRSERWLSTSVQQDRWHEDVSKYSSAEYHTNNLLNPVLFEETIRLVPNNAVLVEVAPHGLLQAILKRSLSANCKHIPLTKRRHPDNALFLLESLGMLYMEGYDLDPRALYPRIEFPVSNQTRQLSHLVEWVHTEEWKVCMYVIADRDYAAVYKPKVTIYEEEFKYLEGCIIEGTRVFPLSGALVFVWDTLSMITGHQLRETSVQFHKVKYHKQLVLHDNKALKLVVMLQRGSGQFEVTNNDMLVVEGYIVAAKTINELIYPASDTEGPMVLNSSDIYKLLYERGYCYKKEFRSIYSSNLPLTKAQLIWRNNWVTFIDGALQLFTLRHDHDTVSQPQYIKRICIDGNTHLNAIKHAENNLDETLIEAVFKNQTVVRCGGLSVEHVTFKDKPLLKQPVALKAHTFVPFFQEANGDKTTTLSVFIQIVAENIAKYEITVLNIDNKKDASILNKVKAMLTGSPVEEIKVIDVKEEDVTKTRNNDTKNPDVIILNRTTCNANILEALCHLYPDAFLITIGVDVQDLYMSSLYKQVSVVGRGLSRVELARWKSKPFSFSTVALTVTRPEDFQDLLLSWSHLPSHQKLIVFTSYPPPNDLKNLVKQWRAKKDRNQVSLAVVHDQFEVDMKLLPSLELAFNVFCQNSWGGEYYVPLKKNCAKESVAALRCSQLGDLSSLYWEQMPNDCHKPGHVKVKVHYAEINVYDAQRALAQISVNNSQEQGFGMSFSGIIESGEYVMGLTPTGSVCEEIWARPELLWPVPKHWSLEDAATVPLAYAIAFQCLSGTNKLLPAKTVLIHGGAGAVGQAALSIALGTGRQVFTTVSDRDKKKFLMNLFPNLPADQIGNSRDDTFKNMVMDGTEGKGCDTVLSCVKGLLKYTTFACCGSGGTTYDVVQIHTQENFEFGMFDLMKSRAYVAVDISSIFLDQNINELQLLLSEGIRAGYVRPLSRVTYAPHDAARAIRLLAASQHRGRVLLRTQDHNMQVEPRLSFSPDFCHMLLCDKDEFGIQFADRLIKRGAKKLCLHVPNISNYLLIKTQLWKKLGVNVRIVAHVLDSIERIRKLFKESHLLGSIEGIYVIATNEMDKEAEDNINSVIFSLDVMSREECPELGYFVMITEDNSISRDIFLKREQSNLNSLSLQLKLGKVSDTDEKIDKNKALMWRTAVDAVEIAVLSNKTFVIVHPETVQAHNVINEVSKIPGVVITSATDDRTALEHVGIDQEHVVDVCTLLEEKFNINIPKDIVPCMTVGQLKNLKAQSMEIDKEVEGFGGYFSYIDGDEMLGSSDLVFMPTLTHTSNTKPDEYEENETYLCIVPGMEGHHERFREMCELLKLPAVVLQLGLDKYRENIQEIAQRLVNVLMIKLKIHNQFYLLGYEFGVPIVIEMALILESYGLTGTVYCLGGTPSDIRSVLEKKINCMNEETLQVKLLQHLHDLILGEETALDKNLRDLSRFSDKVKFCVDNLRGLVTYTSQYIETLLEVAYSRIQLMRHCHTECNALRAKMVILRSKLPEMVSIQNWKLSHQDVVIHELEAALHHAPRDLKCAALINKYLDTDILTKFNNRNRCESYIKNEELP